MTSHLLSRRNPPVRPAAAGPTRTPTRPTGTPSSRPLAPFPPSAPVRPVSARPVGPSLTGVTLELLRLRRAVRLQQILGPVLLVLVGLLQPVAVIDVPGGVGMSRTLWMSVRYFAGRDGAADGPVGASVAWGTALATAGSVLMLAAAVVVLCAWWNELTPRPLRGLTRLVRAAAVALVVGAAALITGQGLLARDGMHGSAWQVGTLLFAAAGIWLVIGATARANRPA